MRRVYQIGGPQKTQEPGSSSQCQKVKSEMDFKSLILMVFGLSFTFCSHFPFRKYYYISTPKTWKDAQLYCREKYTDLATFESMEDLNQLTRPADITGYAWIGLHDDPASWKGTLGNDSNSWRWSTTGQPITSQYNNWLNGQPVNRDAEQTCVGQSSAWYDRPCHLLKSFICYTDVGQNQKTYVFISTEKTWSDAQTYCRQHYTDLAVITNSEENTRVRSLIPAPNWPWIGLSRVPWRWSDKNPTTFTNWQSGEPNNDQLLEHYVAEGSDHLWKDVNFLSELPFICHEVRKSKSTIKVQMKTTADLNDPAVKEQILQKMNAALKSQGWTDPKLRWTTSPSKAQEKLPETQLCGF